MKPSYKMFEIQSLVYPHILFDEVVEALGRLRTSRHIFRIDFLKNLKKHVVAQVE
jgi:hypothetical protein